MTARRGQWCFVINSGIMGDVVFARLLPSLESLRQPGSRIGGEERLVKIPVFIPSYPASIWIFSRNRPNLNLMTSSSTTPLIRRETGDDGVCLLTFDRPDSGANIFDVGALQELSAHLDFIEKESALKGVIVASAKKSIFIAGADLKTLLKQAQTGELRAFIANGRSTQFSIASRPAERFRAAARSTALCGRRRL